ncbi:hypothetical protein L211DRAFT_517553 [Terfezia boudieri ATCC MYA-4762]|uniref:Uncharacterized protein n=1 Tax=Terfezia boudieri ATCC MYA-4762 TaxID=1051890 RepID=A0A3N4LCF9_9PEZI|nr:hypothetical protein L211DRAFT_517553 [Terfezia boudieri ATCC MYA-4762]
MPSVYYPAILSSHSLAQSFSLHYVRYCNSCSGGDLAISWRGNCCYSLQTGKTPPHTSRKSTTTAEKEWQPGTPLILKHVQDKARSGRPRKIIPLVEQAVVMQLSKIDMVEKNTCSTPPILPQTPIFPLRRPHLS